MRVVSGSARGTVLETIEGLDTRPTTDRVKEAVFSMIQTHIYGSSCLDLFSGSGALGIELLSRGADFAVFVESGAKPAKIIQKNLERTQLVEKSKLILGDVYGKIKALKGEKYDIIIMDPPYLSGHVKKTLMLIEQCDLLSESGIIVVEHEISDDEAQKHGTSFECYKSKKYGKIGISVYRRSL